MCALRAAARGRAVSGKSRCCPMPRRQAVRLRLAHEPRLESDHQRRGGRHGCRAWAFHNLRVLEHRRIVGRRTCRTGRARMPAVRISHVARRPARAGRYARSVRLPAFRGRPPCVPAERRRSSATAIPKVFT